MKAILILILAVGFGTLIGFAIRARPQGAESLAPAASSGDDAIEERLNTWPNQRARNLAAPESATDIGAMISEDAPGASTKEESQSRGAGIDNEIERELIGLDGVDREAQFKWLRGTLDRNQLIDLAMPLQEHVLAQLSVHLPTKIDSGDFFEMQLDDEGRYNLKRERVHGRMQVFTAGPNGKSLKVEFSPAEQPAAYKTFEKLVWIEELVTNLPK